MVQVQADQARGEREEDPQHRPPPLHSEAGELQCGHEVPLLCLTFRPWRRTFLSPQGRQKV